MRQFIPGMEVFTMPTYGDSNQGTVLTVNASLVRVKSATGTTHEFDKATQVETMASFGESRYNTPLKFYTTDEWFADDDTNEFRARIDKKDAPMEWFKNLPRERRLRLIEAMENTDDQ